MKARHFIGLGIFALLVGGGMCAIASVQNDFNINTVFVDSSLEEKIISYDEEVLKVIYDGNAEDLIISYNDANETELVYYENDNIKYNIALDSSTSTLSIEKKIEKTWFNQFPFGVFAYTPRCTLKLAKSVKELDIEFNAGRLVIEELDLNRFELELNAGSVTINNSKTNYMEVDIDAGSIYFNDCVIEEGNVLINAGSMNFNGSILTSFKVNVNAGSAVLNLEQDSSQFNVNGVGSGLITIVYEVNAGSFKINYA